MKNLISLFDELQHTPQSRYIRKLLFGGYSSILLIMLFSMLATLKYGSDISELGSDILGSRYPYSIQLLKIKQDISESSQLALGYSKQGDANSLDSYLEKHNSISRKINILNTHIAPHLKTPEDISSIKKKINQISILNNSISKLSAATTRAENNTDINTLYIEINSDISAIISQLMTSSLTDGQLLNKRFNQIISFNIAIMLFALIIGFFIIIKIARNIVNLINEINESRKQSEASKMRSKQKSDELARASQILVKTNKHLSNSIEKLNSTQDQLVQNEKMASLGGLVAGIAHEINTPIGIGVTAASHLEDNIQKFKEKFETGNLKKSEMAAFIQTSNEASYILLKNLERAAKLIQSFKQVAVDQSSEEMRYFNLKEYLQGTILSLHPKLKNTNININLQCPDKLELNSYPGAYSQIFTNFIINSLVHAYKEGESGKINIDIIKNDSSIQLIYCDNGSGVDEEHIPTLFDPFFTTRRGQGGSGLGLHLVYNIVTQLLKGEINAQNNSNGGICFEINVPYPETS